MNPLDESAFEKLFNDAYHKFFGRVMTTPLSEIESTLFAGDILEETGLLIDSIHLRNYSSFILATPESRQEKPPVSSLDTLARYVVGAPHTDHIQRREKESHYPYWFKYRDNFFRSTDTPHKKKWLFPFAMIFMGLAIVATLVVVSLGIGETPLVFNDNFNAVSDDSLYQKGWFVEQKDTVSWNKRTERPGHLTLYTLPGEWPYYSKSPWVKNRVLKKIKADCFAVEADLSDFIPDNNWKQAGIMLLEEASFAGKVASFSLSHDNIRKDGKTSPQIIVLAALYEPGAKKPEFEYKTLFTLDVQGQSNASADLKRSKFQLWKEGNKIKVLFSAGEEGDKKQEGFTKVFSIQPRYIGLYATSAFNDTTQSIPAAFDNIMFTPIKCQ